MASIEPIITNQWVNQEEHRIALKLSTMLENINTSELSLISGISETDIDEYKLCAKPVPVSDLIVIAAIIGANINYFYDDNEAVSCANLQNIPIEKRPELLC